MNGSTGLLDHLSDDGVNEGVDTGDFDVLLEVHHRDLANFFFVIGSSIPIPPTYQPPDPSSRPERRMAKRDRTHSSSQPRPSRSLALYVRYKSSVMLYGYYDYQAGYVLKNEQRGDDEDE